MSNLHISFLPAYEVASFAYSVLVDIANLYRNAYAASWTYFQIVSTRFALVLGSVDGLDYYLIQS